MFSLAPSGVNGSLSLLFCCVLGRQQLWLFVRTNWSCVHTQDRLLMYTSLHFTCQN